MGVWVRKVSFVLVLLALFGNGFLVSFLGVSGPGGSSANSADF